MPAPGGIPASIATGAASGELGRFGPAGGGSLSRDSTPDAPGGDRAGEAPAGLPASRAGASVDSHDAFCFSRWAFSAAPW